MVNGPKFAPPLIEKMKVTTTAAADMFITIGLQLYSFVQLAPSLTPRNRAEVSLKGLDLTVPTFS